MISEHVLKLSLRNKLRQLTRVEHEHVEAALQLSVEDLSQVSYQRYLRAMFAAHTAFAAMHDRGCCQTGLAPISHVLVDALRADLGFAAVPQEALILNDAQAVGVAYAFEGASVGAGLLRQRLAACGLVVATRYLELLTTRSADRWRQLRDALERISDSPQQYVQGARRVFSYINEQVANLRSE